jgi:hypothetical protein
MGGYKEGDGRLSRVMGCYVWSNCLLRQGSNPDISPKIQNGRRKQRSAHHSLRWDPWTLAKRWIISRLFVPLAFSCTLWPWPDPAGYAAWWSSSTLYECTQLPLEEHVVFAFAASCRGAGVLTSIKFYHITRFFLSEKYIIYFAINALIETQW